MEDKLYAALAKICCYIRGSISEEKMRKNFGLFEIGKSEILCFIVLLRLVDSINVFVIRNRDFAIAFPYHSDTITSLK